MEEPRFNPTDPAYKPVLHLRPRQIIESGNDDLLATNLAAVRTVMAFHQNSKGRIGKNKVVRKFLKREEKGKLEAEIAKIM
ncbi:hypothetical protein [Neolewinella persica]|uniref:hypothetical protein n=1 Tax=Neolewinella persica TaxID=70998 RepID=UPI0003681134|nr:hypothetical protein [Neolewinella persica]